MPVPVTLPLKIPDSGAGSFLYLLLWFPELRPLSRSCLSAPEAGQPHLLRSSGSHHQFCEVLTSSYGHCQREALLPLDKAFLHQQPRFRTGCPDWSMPFPSDLRSPLHFHLLNHYIKCCSPKDISAPDLLHQLHLLWFFFHQYNNLPLSFCSVWVFRSYLNR